MAYAYSPELEKLIKLYEKAETDIVEAISYKRKRGYVEVADEAALERVREVLSNLNTDTWVQAPKAIQQQFFRGRAHAIGLTNARALTSTNTAVIEQLVGALVGTLVEATGTVNNVINRTWAESVVLGRRPVDTFRTSVLEALSEAEATGYGISQARVIFIDKMKNEGITAFVDKKNRKWSLRTYADMAIRTSGRQSTNLGTILADEAQDLYLMSSHATSCPICAPLEGRVYSRSGTSPYYPPLASAFGKIDPNGPNTLDNSWLNIHPNCLHVLTQYTEQGKSEAEIRRMREFSSFSSNPPTIDPRPMAEVKAYRRKEHGRTKLLSDYRQFERYKLTLGNKVPKTFQTFQKHKIAKSEKYQEWMRLYRQRNQATKKLSV